MFLPIRRIALFVLFAGLAGRAAGHDHTRHKAEQLQLAAQQKAADQAETPPQPARQATCQLTLQLRDAARRGPLPGIVRLTNLATGKSIPIPNEIDRALNWYSVAADVTVTVPQGRVRVEAFHGIESERATLDLDLAGKNQMSTELPLKRFFDHGAPNGAAAIRTCT
jgi:hypothetical protein